MVTGEPLPVAKQVGDKLIGGTVNHTGLLVMRAVRVGSETTLAQIIRLVEDAQSAKAPIQVTTSHRIDTHPVFGILRFPQSFADKTSSLFVPVVVSLALITFLFWFFVTSFGMLPEKYMPHGTSLRSSCHIQRAHDTHRHRHRHTDTAHTQRTKDDGHERCTNDTVPYSLFYFAVCERVPSVRAGGDPMLGRGAVQIG